MTVNALVKVAKEITKFLGVIAWIVGLLTLNLFILGFAVLASVIAIKDTRDRKHQELVAAIKESQQEEGSD